MLFYLKPSLSQYLDEFQATVRISQAPQAALNLSTQLSGSETSKSVKPVLGHAAKNQTYNALLLLQAARLLLLTH